MTLGKLYLEKWTQAVTTFIKLLIVIQRFFAVFLRRYNRNKPMLSSKSTGLFIFISPIHQKIMMIIRENCFNQLSALWSIMVITCRQMEHKRKPIRDTA